MIIVTGANGFIGSVILWDLESAGHKNLIAVDMVSPMERPSPLSHRKIANYLDKNELWQFLHLLKIFCQLLK